MVVYYLNIIKIFSFCAKTNSELLVYADAVLPVAVS